MAVSAAQHVNIYFCAVYQCLGKGDVGQTACNKLGYVIEDSYVCWGLIDSDDVR